MTHEEALTALAIGLADSGMTADEITALGKNAGRGLKMLQAIGKRAEAAAAQAKAATLTDEATSLEQQAQKG